MTPTMLILILYVLGAIVIQLVARALEVVSIIERNARWGTKVSSEDLRDAWALEKGYETKAFTWVFYTIAWPIGIFGLPFMYFDELCYIFGYPFRKVVVPYWLTFEALAARVNKGKK